MNVAHVRFQFEVLSWKLVEQFQFFVCTHVVFSWPEGSGRGACTSSTAAYTCWL